MMWSGLMCVHNSYKALGSAFVFYGSFQVQYHIHILFYLSCSQTPAKSCATSASSVCHQIIGRQVTQKPARDVISSICKGEHGSWLICQQQQVIYKLCKVPVQHLVLALLGFEFMEFNRRSFKLVSEWHFTQSRLVKEPQKQIRCKMMCVVTYCTVSSLPNFSSCHFIRYSSVQSIKQL